ncbi:MAG: aminoglycoside phosphotransferase family protein [Chitinophagaceae bacterium]
METAPYQEALAAFTHQHNLTVTPISEGLINQTYKVTNEKSGERFLLQQINNIVFPEPQHIQDNYEKIWSWLQDKKNTKSIKIPRPLQFPGNKQLFRDSHQRYWRVVEFIDGAQTFHNVTNSNQAKKVAEAFGNFTAGFSDFDPSTLVPVIPGFHDLSLRYQQFQQALYSAEKDRLLSARATAEELKKRERYTRFYETIISSDEFKLRVMHHDAKISNILFDAISGDVICPVDLDTCMQGYFFSDLGDMIRSMTCPEDENSTDLGAINIKKELYSAIVNGYLESMHGLLTPAEIEHIHYAGLIVIYMQALRFLADYLNRDVYYQTNYPGQNLDRAKNQLLLLEQLEAFLATESL